MTTYVFPKKGASSIVASQKLSLQPGESITGVVVGYSTPHDNSLFALGVSSGTANPITFTISGGRESMTYGTPLTVTTNQRVLSLTIAVACTPELFDPYENQDPGAYQDLVGEIAAGKSALATATFQFAPDFDPSGGFVIWDLLDAEGLVYASGNAYEYQITSTGVSNVVNARCVISVPIDIPATIGEPYQLRYTLRVGDGVAFSYENLKVLGMTDVQMGTQDAVELVGDTATVALATEHLYQSYALELYAGNSLIASMAAGSPDRIASGYYVAGSFDTAALTPSLVPYSVLWKFYNHPNQVFRESAALWIINPSIAQAVDDVKSKINKARQTLFGTPDSQYPTTEIMKWLRRGMDMFNNAHGVFTSFTMTNAMGGVREFWLLCAEKAALEAQYGLEAEKSFNFSGAAISLDVDRTQYLDAMIGKIDQVLDAQLKPFKQNLIIKGNTGGDGSGPNGDGNFGALQQSSMGSVAIAITPASIYNIGSWNVGVIRR
jgi:hypothetical protein